MSGQTNPPINMIDADSAAVQLGVSRRTLQRWFRLRKGPPVIKVGRSHFYRQSAINHWLISLEIVHPVAGGR